MLGCLVISGITEEQQNQCREMFNGIHTRGFAPLYERIYHVLQDQREAFYASSTQTTSDLLLNSNTTQELLIAEQQMELIMEESIRLEQKNLVEYMQVVSESVVWLPVFGFPLVLALLLFLWRPIKAHFKNIYFDAKRIYASLPVEELAENQYIKKMVGQWY